MHTYPLHQDVAAICDCCRVVQYFQFTSKHDQVICKSCVRHVGADTPEGIKQRERDHQGLWVSEVQIAQEDRDQVRKELQEFQKVTYQEKRALEADNGRLKESIAQGFSDASPADVQRIMTDQAVRDAVNERDAAYRSRDRLWRLLWRLDERHRPEQEEGACFCGQRRCSVLELVHDDDRQSLYAWERRQVERSRAGRAHGLPREHPDYREAY